MTLPELIEALENVPHGSRAKLTTLQRECLVDLKNAGGWASPYELGRTYSPFKYLFANALVERSRDYDGKWVSYRITDAGRAVLTGGEDGK